MKIAIISIINEPWGGSEELWAAMASEAMQNGHEVFFCSYAFEKQHPKVAALQTAGLKLLPRRAYVPNSARGFKRKVMKFWHLSMNYMSNPYKNLLKSNPDLLLYNGTSLSIIEDPLLWNTWMNFQGAKIILAHYIPEHNVLLMPDNRTALRNFFESATEVWFVSNRTAEVTARTIAAGDLKYQIVRNPVNMRSIALVPYPSQGDALQLAMVGNLLTMHKGQDAMLEVLGSEVWKDANWHLNIYGTGMDEAYLKALTILYGITDKVTFHGRVDDIRKLWEQNHMLLMPSVMEGMPLAVVEAMLCGRPVLATNVGGHKEWIDDNINGFIAATSNYDSLNEAFGRAWQQRDAWEAMGKMAHEKAMQLYDPNPGKTLLRMIEKITMETNNQHA